MPGKWRDSKRRSRLPVDWPIIRVKVLSRAGYRCEHMDDGIRCGRIATDVDHVIPGDNHSLSNLQALCPTHHGQKSSREGNQARRQKYRGREEDHPGYR